VRGRAITRVCSGPTGFGPSTPTGDADYIAYTDGAKCLKVSRASCSGKGRELGFRFANDGSASLPFATLAGVGMLEDREDVSNPGALDLGDRASSPENDPGAEYHDASITRWT
jgi:hypothetical protein